MARGPAKRREGLRDFSPVETDDAGRSKTRSERSHDRHFACDEVAQADFNRREAEERNNGRERGQTRNEAEGYLKLAADAEKDRAPSGSLRSCNSVERSRHIVRSATVFPVVGFTRADTRPFGWRFRPNSQLMVKKYLRPAGPSGPKAPFEQPGGGRWGKAGRSIPGIALFPCNKPPSGAMGKAPVQGARGCDPLEGLATRQGDVRALVVSCYGRRGPAGIVLVGLLAAALLSGCSTGDAVSTVMIDPAHYSVYHCDGLQARLKALQSREQELSNLMLRASEGGGGALIGNLTYRADYENALGEEKVLRRTAAEKKCDLPPPPQPVSSAPAAYTATPAAPAAPPAGPVFQSDKGIR